MVRIAKGQTVNFNPNRRLKYLKKLGQGGTGETRLFLDEDMGLKFAIKKYLPSQGNDQDECYQRFVDEIKILYTLNHPNIVRIFSYYLYPNQKTGFIQMEYIDGATINNTSPDFFNKTWNDYFVAAIDAFNYIHSLGILHRDVRPTNFMIDWDGNLKIIDFGFGKKIDVNNVVENSIYLNWPATIMPEELSERLEYDFSTEIYFIGVLFKHLTKGDEAFLYGNILEKMTQVSSEQRYSSCTEIKTDIASNFFYQIAFKDTERKCYANFANSLSNIVTEFLSEPDFCHDIRAICDSLAKIVRRSAPELEVHACHELIQCFTDAPFRHTAKTCISTNDLTNFYRMFIGMPQNKQELIMESIIARLKEIKVEEYIDIPF